MVGEVFGKPMIGIIQGRLTNSGGKLQCFPNDSYKEEFFKARSIGLDYIELISDPEPNRYNPLWSGDIEGLKAVIGESGIEAYSLTVDHIMHRPLTSNDVSIAQKSKEDLVSILKVAEGIGVKVAVLPFLEGASLKEGLVGGGIEIINEISKATSIKIAIESDLSVGDQIKICESCNVGVCYDTGNRTHFGFNLKEEILLLNKNIIHVHIKDKDKNGKNVMLGEGAVDLSTAIIALKSVNYPGNHTLETSRGDEEVSAAVKNLSYLKALLK